MTSVTRFSETIITKALIYYLCFHAEHLEEINCYYELIDYWCDCHPGTDDAFAIVMALFDPRLNLLSISSVAGNRRSAAPQPPGRRRPHRQDRVHGRQSGPRQHGHHVRVQHPRGPGSGGHCARSRRQEARSTLHGPTRDHSPGLGDAQNHAENQILKLASQ